MEKYEIMTGDNKYELTDKVNRAIKEYKMMPLGGVSVMHYNMADPVWIQAMIRKGK